MIKKKALYENKIIIKTAIRKNSIDNNQDKEQMKKKNKIILKNKNNLLVSVIKFKA